MREVVIVSAVRTPVGKAYKGTLRATRPDDLGAVAIKGALERVPQLDVREIEDVILGCAKIGRKAQASFLDITANQLFKAGLVNRNASGSQLCDPFAIDIDTNNFVAAFGKASAADESNVARTHHRDIHAVFRTPL